jgi:ligand-binding sensor domain-containing protein/two-component sensor histidine kinase
MIDQFRIFLWMLLLAVIVAEGWAQPLPPEAHFNRYTIQDGLPGNYIKGILQDDQGFLWIATDAGLSCFDGVHFTNYFKGDDLQRSLPSNSISKLAKLSNGQIFIATRFGVSLLDPVSRTFKSMRIPYEPGMEYEQNAIKSLILTNQGHIVTGSNAGICVFDEGLNIVFHYSHFKKENLDKNLMGFALDMVSLASGDILINGWQGAWRFDAAARKLEEQDSTHYSERFAEWAHAAGKKGTSIVWKDFPDTLFVNDFQSNKNGMTLVPKEIRKELSWGSKLEFVNDTLMGFAGANGGFRLAVCHPATLRVNFYERQIFKDPIFNAFLLDREGRWWLASEDGLFGQSFSKGAFHFIPLQIGQEGEGENNYISALTKAGDYFYIGANNRLLVMDSQLRLLNNIAVPPQIGNIHKLYSWQSGILDIGGNFAWARLQIPKKWDRPLQWKKIGKGEIANIFQLKDRHGDIWGGMFMGLARYNPSTGKEFYYATGQPDGEFPFMGAIHIIETDSGYLWMCGWPGLTRWNPFEQCFDRRYPRVPGTEGQEGRPTSLASNGGEEMLFNMGDNKLWHWFGDERPAREIKLSSYVLEQIIDILPDKKPHQFWFLLKTGIALFDVPTGKSRFYANHNELANETAITDFYLDPNSDSIYICYENGIVVTNRKNFHFSNQPVPIFITGIQQLSTGQMLGATSNLHLEQPGQDIAISFSSPDFERGGLLTYAYRLNDGKWQSLGPAKSVQLVNLSPGSYHFEVKSITPEGISSNPAVLDFGVKPRFYQTWWFVILLAAAFGLAVFGYFRWRLGQLRKMEAMRQSIATDLHDEVGASLTSIQILSQLASHPDPDRRREALEKLPEQVRHTSASLREIVWSINPKGGALDLLIGEMTRHAGEVFEKSDIEYTVQADAFPASAVLESAPRQHLVRIFKEILNNIAKHSRASRAAVHYKKEKNALTLVVRDNGQGFDPATVHRGNGLNNMQQRAAAVGGQLQLRSNPTDGTEIELRIPFKQQRNWWPPFGRKK